MDYVIIIPAYNEVEHLPRAVTAILAQTLRPRQLILVNDNSTDDTGDLIDEYARQHAFIRAVHRRSSQQVHSGGAKVVATFYSGFEQISEPYEFLVKLDADCEVPPDYFARMAALFTSDDRIGIAGGRITTLRAGDWQRENIADEGHILGAFKSWRKACFSDIGGLRPTIGWDSIDEMLALYHGWTVGYDPELEVRHHRPIHTHTGLRRVHRRIGAGLYKCRMGFLVSSIAGAKAALRYGNPGCLFAVWRGYYQAWHTGSEQVVSPPEGRFLRRYTLKNAAAKLGWQLSLDGYYAPR